MRACTSKRHAFGTSILNRSRKMEGFDWDFQATRLRTIRACVCPPSRQPSSGLLAGATDPISSPQCASAPPACPPANGSAAPFVVAPVAVEPEDPVTSLRLLEKLREAGITHTTLEHVPTRTSEESAAVRGVPLSSGAKALFMIIRKPAEPGAQPYLLAVMSASRKADLSALKKAIGVKNMAMASAEEVWEVTRCRPGAVPPFGSLFSGVRTVIDRSLLTQGERINFNAGLRTLSVGMAVQDYVQLEGPTVLDFTT